MSTAISERPIEQPERLKWTRDRYYAMIDAGIIHEDEKFELIGGDLLTEGMGDRMGQDAEHSMIVTLVAKLLDALFGEGFHVRSQVPLALLDDSDPEPDIAVVTGTPRDYARAHPRSAELVVEVSGSSLRFDRAYKGSLYASAGISDYWIINLVDRQLEVYRASELAAGEPYGHRFANASILHVGDVISPMAKRDVSIPVEALLP